MGGVPRSPSEDSNRQDECHSDNGEPSKAAFPILTVPHPALHISLVILISSCLGEQRQDTLGDVDSNDLRRIQALGLERRRHLR
jgi:hypothetical protein